MFLVFVHLAVPFLPEHYSFLPKNIISFPEVNPILKVMRFFCMKGDTCTDVDFVCNQNTTSTLVPCPLPTNSIFKGKVGSQPLSTVQSVGFFHGNNSFVHYSLIPHL